MSECTWIKFYESLANKLVEYKGDRKQLIEVIKRVHKEAEKELPRMCKDDSEILDIDPFTVFALFNRGSQSLNVRIKLCEGFKKVLGLKEEVPTDFNGIPKFNFSQYCFYTFDVDFIENKECFETLWNLFESAIVLPNGEKAEMFKKYFEKALQLEYIGISKLTMALFQIRPQYFVSLDKKNKVEIQKQFEINIEVNNADEYLLLCDKVREKILKDSSFSSVADFSHYAYMKKDDSMGSDGRKRKDKEKQTKRYWIYSPGKNAKFWEVNLEESNMSLGWKNIGDFSKFETKKEISQELNKEYGDNVIHKNDVTAIWQFCHEMQKGDIVFVKKGRNALLGMGEVIGDYEYVGDRKEYTSIRKVNWTHVGNWEHPGKAVTKVLTDITKYTEYIQKLLKIFEEDNKKMKQDGTIKLENERFEKYTKADLLNEVYIEERKLDSMIRELERKKNIVLQGAPGVGKTYIAKRLAYSMMGCKDESRISFVQFHQNYTYEDFVMGYRPTDDGFELQEGIFYKFCKVASSNPEKEYFFIIDEINRGNLSKIFGDILMLIENKYRGQTITLTYRGKQFTVPKNISVIGLMNTSDRSIALVDHALRRRFGIVPMKPGFETKQFQEYLESVNNVKLNNLIEVVIELNTEISNDETLGEGFCIGHSNFCNLKEEKQIDETLIDIVEYEIIPTLEEYWFDEKEKLNKWYDKLRRVVNDRR